MKAIDILDHMMGLWHEPPRDTVDRVIYGDPQREVQAIATCWMPYRETLQRARQIGANVIVAHEPTFFAHRDLDDPSYSQLTATREKMKLIDDLGVSIVRCHDVWVWGCPELGSFRAWVDFLELGEPITKDTRTAGKYFSVHQVPAQRAITFARRLARKTSLFGQTLVPLYGDPDREIRSVGVGLGSAADPFSIHALGADMAIACDEDSRLRAWISGEWCHDTGYPMAVVHHAVTEEPGVAALARYLSEAFPQVTVTHLRQGCVHREVACRGTARPADSRSRWRTLPSCRTEPGLCRS